MKRCSHPRIAETCPAIGRPSKLSMLSDADRATFMERLRNGCPQAWACRSIRMSTATLANYRARAAQGDEPYLQFVLDMEQASAAYVCERLRIIDSAGIGVSTGKRRGRGDYRAIAWLLERLFPRDFALTATAEVAIKDGTHLVDGPTPRDAAAIVRAAFGDHARPALENSAAMETDDEGGGESCGAS